MVWHLAKKRALGIYAVSGSDLKHSSIAAKREGERKGGGRGSELPLVESINNGDDGLKARERGRDRKEREVEDETEGMRR